MATQKKTKSTKSKINKANATKANVTVDANVEKAVKVSKATAMSKDVLFSASKHDIISLFATKDGDTGSPEVQIAIATQKILLLTKHLEQNPKDNHSRRGLLKIIAKRRRIIQYLHSKDAERYLVLIAKLDLKR